MAKLAGIGAASMPCGRPANSLTPLGVTASALSTGPNLAEKFSDAVALSVVQRAPAGVLDDRP